MTEIYEAELTETQRMLTHFATTEYTDKALTREMLTDRMNALNAISIRLQIYEKRGTLEKNRNEITPIINITIVRLEILNTLLEESILQITELITPQSINELITELRKLNLDTIGSKDMISILNKINEMAGKAAFK